MLSRLLLISFFFRHNRPRWEWWGLLGARRRNLAACHVPLASPTSTFFTASARRGELSESLECLHLAWWLRSVREKLKPPFCPSIEPPRTRQRNTSNVYLLLLYCSSTAPPSFFRLIPPLMWDQPEQGLPGPDSHQHQCIAECRSSLPSQKERG